jgi:hypothetical protein
MAGAETTPATEAPTTPGEKKRLSKYVSRMKTILRRGDSSKRTSSSSMTAPVVASSATPPAEYVLKFHTSHSTSYIQGPLLIVDVLSTVKTEPASETTPAPTKRTTEELERARHLAQKYNIDLDTSDWKIIEVAERVEKPIRMRIHRTCHVCNTSYGANKTCASCGHERCEQCPRYPKKKVLGGKGKDVTYLGGQKGPGVEAIEGLKRKHKYVLTLPSKTGGQDLVMKKPMQRVRRMCHRCDNVFMPGNKICSKCEHVRCVDCPRDP